MKFKRNTFIECFMPDCLLNIQGYCMNKPNNIAPNDKACGEMREAKEK